MNPGGIASPNFEEKVIASIRALWMSLIVLVAFLCLSIGLASWAIVSWQGTSGRLHRDETLTCRIQENGLPAGHELAVVQQDWHLIAVASLKQPTPKHLSAAERKTQAEGRALVTKLNNDLATYLQDEARQPSTRVC